MRQVFQSAVRAKQRIEAEDDLLPHLACLSNHVDVYDVPVRSLQESERRPVVFVDEAKQIPYSRHY